MFFVVVLRAVTVSQLDQTVVVRQAGVRLAETPGTEAAEQLGSIYFTFTVKRLSVFVCVFVPHLFST